MKTATKIADLPTKEFFAIFTETSTFIPGDERSRTNPGHGYSESTEYNLSVKTFIDKNEFQAEVKRLAGLVFHQAEWKAVKITPIEVTTEIKINISE